MCLLIIGGVILAILLLDYLLKPKLDFPMPFWRIPLIGHALFLGKKPEATMETWSKKLGPVYMIQAFNLTIVVINDNTVFQKMCDSGDFEGRNHSVRFGILACSEKYGQPKDFFQQDANEVHTKLKRFTMGKAAEIRNSSYFAELMTHTQNNLEREIVKKSKQNIVDPYDIVTNVLFNYNMCMVNGTLYSLDSVVSEKMAEVNNLTRVCMKTTNLSLECCPKFLRFTSKTYTGLKKILVLTHEIFQEMQRQVKEEGPNLGLASAYLNDNEWPDEPNDVMEALLVGNFVGAAAPSIPSLYGIIMMLAAHPEVQEKLREEIFRRKLTKPFIPSGHDWCPYVQAFVMESLRHTVPVPMFVRRALTDTTLNGKFVSKGTNVLVNLFADHHNEDIYTDPWVLKPERFLDSSGNLLPESHPVRQHFKGLGAGKKVCLGYPVINEVFCALTLSIVDAFDISPAPGIDVPYDCRKWVGLAVAAFPAQCPMKFTPRK